MMDYLTNIVSDPQIQALGVVLGVMGGIGYWIIKEPKAETAPQSEISDLQKRVTELETRANIYSKKE